MTRPRPPRLGSRTTRYPNLPAGLRALLVDPFSPVTTWMAPGPDRITVTYWSRSDSWRWSANGHAGRADYPADVLAGIRAALARVPVGCAGRCYRARRPAKTCTCPCAGRHHGRRPTTPEVPHD